MNRLVDVIEVLLIIAALACASAVKGYQVTESVLEIDRNHKATHLT